MSVKYILPYFIKSKINIINNEITEIIPPEDICYDHMSVKEATRDKINKLWPIILKDSEKLCQIGSNIISCYPVTNKDKILKEYFINNKSKILKIYEEFDKLFNEILKNTHDYHDTIYASRFMYRLKNYSNYYFKHY